jgi:formate--tetrahydrofolate ligase
MSLDSTSPRPIEAVAEEAGFAHGDVLRQGAYKAKVDHRLAAGATGRRARLVLVTGVTPTPAGEGKTVTTIGLSMALARLGRRAIATLRQPSMGPVFGIRGGGAGGGRSAVVPMEELNLHLTGDLHAIAAAHNLLAAALDTSLLFDNPLHLDPERVTWRRVVDLYDRALRQVRVGLGGARNGIPHDSGFDCTPASEVMSVVGLARDRADLRRRLAAIVVGDDLAGAPVTAADLEVAGAMAAVLRDAIDPTLMQTREGTPVLVHTGPFAHVSTGCSSVLADAVAASACEVVVTEAGFGADLGAERFFNVKSRVAGRNADAVVLVATVRALKTHSGQFPLEPTSALPAELLAEDLEALGEGCTNLEAQLETVTLHGLPVVVAINRFPSDTDAEVALVRERALAAGARACEVSEVHARGGEGGAALGAAVLDAVESGEAAFRHLYDLDAPVHEKIETVATRVYGAGSVEFSQRAVEDVARHTARGYGGLPICIAKTQYSLSHEAQFKGRPRGYVFPVREVRLCAGAGFLVPVAGDVETMPGLGRSPAYRGIDIDADGRITGLS